MKKILGLFICVSMVCLTLYVPKVEAKTLGDLKKELQEFQDKYEKNKQQQAQNEQEKKNVENKIYQTKRNIADIGEEVISLNEEIEKLNENIASKEEEIKSIISFTQVSNGEPAYLEYAFGAEDFTDFIYRMAVSEQVTSYNNELVNSYKNDIEANNKKAKELEVKKEQLNSQQESYKEDLVKIQDDLSELDDLALDIETQIKQRKSAIKVYEDKGCKDSEDIATCGQKVLPPDTTFWRPIPVGYITGWFGYRDCTDPRVSCYHNGLDMSNYNANEINYPVYAVANGVVVSIINSYSDSKNYKCGGKRVFIEHKVNGKTYSSGYLHLRQIKVKVGQTVTKDTVIGIMGGNPSRETWDKCSTGAHLHLEMSYGTISKGDYYSRRVHAGTIINFPKTKYTYWKSRNAKF